ncbi:MAG: restriction endonuclease subunit S [Ruminococcus sp.]|nr:restriction endonuclease subunit S [Ruminococcus sp.]MEE0600160.1 restriction endonuclease subunit S [Ruminococcus sp.]
MREMKDSGISWIPKIPINWSIHRLKYIVDSLSKGNGITKEDVLLNGDTPCVRYGEIYSKYDYSFTTCISRTNVDKVSSPQYFSYGDILFAGTGELIEEIGMNIVYLGDYDCLAGGDIIIARHQQNPAFLNYALNSGYIQSQKGFGKAKLKVVHISAFDLGNLIVALPPITEQKLIADYLDSKCAEFNSTLSDIQSQIEALEEYKRSVITEAVTKGLDPDVEMRDSGVQWIGEIPTHWTLIRIGSLYGLRTQKVSDIDYPPLSVTKMGVLPQLDTVAKTNAHDDRKLIVKGDFVINSRSDRRGSCGISDYTGSVSLINTVLFPITEMNPRYYNWYFHTVGFADEFYRWGHGIVDDLWTTGWQDMKNILISVPPLDEQQRIADYLDSKCAEIDNIITEKKQQIETIEEYKKSLIFEYVTGKKEVA